MDASDDDRKMQFEWLRSEQESIHKQFQSYIEADQKIIAAMATISVGIIGLSAVKIADIDTRTIPYVIFLASFLMSLAINQSSMYSSLILICLERRYDLSEKMGEFLGCDKDFTLSHASFAKFRSIDSYAVNVAPYWIFKMVIGPVLSFSGLIYGLKTHRSGWLVIAFVLSIAFATASAIAVYSNARSQNKFQELSRKFPGTGDPLAWLATLFPRSARVVGTASNRLKGMMKTSSKG